jgi:hypothetical protein
MKIKQLFTEMRKEIEDMMIWSPKQAKDFELINKYKVLQMFDRKEKEWS